MPLMKYGLHHLNADTMKFILDKIGYSNLAAFEAEHPDFKFTIDLPNANSVSFLPASSPLVNFTFKKYKKCLLVKHPQNLRNSGGIPNEYQGPSFSRPMYWNQSLKGWVASQKDLNHLKNLGATPSSN